MRRRRYGPSVVLTLAAGTISKATVQSRILNEEREIDIYTPPRYNPAAGTYPLLIMFDAELYTAIDLPATLDNLISERRIPAIVTVQPRRMSPLPWFGKPVCGRIEGTILLPASHVPQAAASGAVGSTSARR